LVRNTGPMHRHIYIILLAAVTFWCLLILLPAFSDISLFFHHCSALINLFFSPVCHQQAERTFHICNHPMAVCARCSGIYFGFLGGLILYPLLSRLFKSRPGRWLFIAGCIPTIADIIWERILRLSSSNTIRGISGLILGMVCGYILLPYILEVFDYKKQ